MTPIGSSAPLPAREGLGVGAERSEASAASAERRPAGVAPTPGPSLAGRGVADASRLKSKDNLDKAGKQFEAVFTGMMLKSMRQAKLADPLFSSKALDTFRDMADQKTVQAMAEATPLGIGKALTKFLGTEFLSRSQDDLKTPAG